jgi:hypothetical protein
MDLDVKKLLLNGGGRDWGRAPARPGLARADLQMRVVEILHTRPRPRPPCHRAPTRKDADNAAQGSVPDTVRSGDLVGGQGWAGTGPRLT